ncbi:MAG: CHASE3 domain-containing protein, partial [Pseudomonadota bacterium]|nr:CHASE3 domain-containing protein [Pseudomonadota bacterium]
MGLSRLSINARLIVAFSLVVAVFAILITVATVGQQKQAAAQRSNIQTYDTLEQVNGLNDAIVNMETGARGFLLAGVDSFLEPLTKGRQQFAVSFARIEELTDDRRVMQKLETLRTVEQDW